MIVLCNNQTQTTAWIMSGMHKTLTL